MLGSLRWKTGTDWESYYDSFYYFSEAYEGYYEPGYLALLSFIRGFTSNYTLFLTVLTFLSISIKVSFFFKYHKEFFFTLLFLFYCYYFGDIFAVRQNLAVSLTLFSTVFIIKRKPICFVLAVLLASSFHTSAVLYFFAYYFYWNKINDKVFYYLIGFSILFGLVGVGGIILNLILKALGIEGFVGEKINNYLNGDGDDFNSNPLISYLLGVVKRLLLIPVFIYIKNRSQERFVNIQGYFNLYMIGNIIYFLFAKDLVVFVRASVPYLLFEIFLIGYTLLYFKSSKKKLLLIFVFTVLFSWSRFSALVNSYYDFYVPYNSIFDKKIERIF